MNLQLQRNVFNEKGTSDFIFIGDSPRADLVSRKRVICSMQSGPRSSRLSTRTVEAGAVGADEYLLRQFLLDLFRDFIQELSFCDNMVSLKVDSYIVTHHNV